MILLSELFIVKLLTNKKTKYLKSNQNEKIYLNQSFILNLYLYRRVKCFIEGNKKKERVKVFLELEKQ